MSVGVFQGISSGALRMSDFTINIIEGPVYHVGPVQIVGIDPGRANVMRRTFPMKEGQVYNPDIIDKAIEQLNRSGRFHPLSRSDVEITVHELDRTVSLVFQLREE
jgi:outer membrane protein assembly factor BamA